MTYRAGEGGEPGTSRFQLVRHQHSRKGLQKVGLGGKETCHVHNHSLPQSTQAYMEYLKLKRVWENCRSGNVSRISPPTPPLPSPPLKAGDKSPLGQAPTLYSEERRTSYHQMEFRAERPQVKTLLFLQLATPSPNLFVLSILHKLILSKNVKSPWLVALGLPSPWLPCNM